MWLMITLIEEIIGRLDQGVDALEKFTVRDFSPETAPEHFDGIEPRAIRGQIEQNKPTRSPAHHRFNFIILMRIGIIPGHIDGFIRMLLQQCFQEFGDFLPTFASADQHHRLARMVVDGTNPVMFLSLAWRGDHHLLTAGTPHRHQGGQPRQIEFIGIVEHFLRF